MGILTQKKCTANVTVHFLYNDIIAVEVGLPDNRPIHHQWWSRGDGGRELVRLLHPPEQGEGKGGNNEGGDEDHCPTKP